MIQFIVCAYCGMEFEANGMGRQICSSECAREIGKHVVVCTNCGTEFETSYHNAKFCSLECKIAGRGEWAVGYYSKPEVRERRREQQRESKRRKKLARSESISQMIEPFPE